MLPAGEWEKQRLALPIQLWTEAILFISLSFCSKASCFKPWDTVLVVQILVGLGQVHFQSACKSDSFTIHVAFLHTLGGLDQLPRIQHFTDFPGGLNRSQSYEAVAGTRAPLAFQLRGL